MMKPAVFESPFGLVRARFVRLALAMLCAASSVLPAAALAQRKPADVPVVDFFRLPTLRQPTLSPDGTRIAMLVPGVDGRNALAVADVENPSRRVGIARFSDADIREFAWVNDKRLVLSMWDPQAPMGEQILGGLYAVDADGSDFVFLVGRGRQFESGGHVAIRPLRFNHRLARTVRDGSDDVIVERFNFLDYEGQAGGTTLLRLNTRTRATRELVTGAPPNLHDWVFDQKGVPRAALSYDGKRTLTVHARKAPDASWREIDRFDLYARQQGSLTPVDFEPDGRLVVSALRDDPGRTSALFHFDLDAERPSKTPFFALKDFDAEASLIVDQTAGRTIGLAYTSDAKGINWLDAGMKALQERIDALLPGTNNLIVCGRSCLTQRRMLITAYSDRQPAVYFVFDRQGSGKAALQLIGPSMPWIDASLMASQDFVRIRARDGMEIPVYVTRPQGKGPFPTVMLVHGGPYVRGHEWGWMSDPQFLASRGYLVVEPEFRGSTGYGDKLFKAGWKQWGRSMQDDVTDATRWAVQQGMADPKRMVIAGASYGGYATMMGLVKEPELYRAGINWVGVTDIELMYDIDWSDFAGSAWQRYGMKALVGDPKLDKAQLDETSPLKRAKEIGRPVLMAYGDEDYRVPLPHGTKMRDALKASGRAEVEWVQYPQEGHGFLLEKNRVDFWTRVERFLERHTR